MDVQISRSISSIRNVESFNRLNKFKFFGKYFFILMIFVPLAISILSSLVIRLVHDRVTQAEIFSGLDFDKIFSVNKSSLKCHKHAYPYYNTHLMRYHCVCLSAFSGNGRTVCESCGSIRKKHKLRIVGGEEASVSSWPMAVYLEQTYKHTYSINGTYKQLNKKWGCGGILINHHYVLTAAHCIRDVAFLYDLNSYTKIYLPITWNNLYPNVESTISVYLGVHNIRGISSSRRVRVKRYIRYPSYCYNDRSQDIGLLELDEFIRPNKNIGFSCLPPTNDEEYPGLVNNTVVIGWGKLGENETTSDVLHNVVLKIIPPNTIKSNEKSDKECSRSSALICAGEMKGGKDSCLGDSGNGLYIKDANLTSNEERIVVAGIVSFGIGCARPDNPGTYTRVSYYRDWILANTQY